MKIIAIQMQPTTTHVYSWEAYQELNIKQKKLPRSHDRCII